MLPQECREAFWVQTMHPYFQLTKRKGVERCTRQHWLELARERELCVSVLIRLRGPMFPRD